VVADLRAGHPGDAGQLLAVEQQEAAVTRSMAAMPGSCKSRRASAHRVSSPAAGGCPTLTAGKGQPWREAAGCRPGEEVACRLAQGRRTGQQPAVQVGMAEAGQRGAAARRHSGAPGGVLELDEPIEDGLRREVCEEPASLLSLTSSPASTRT
jgi:hypothetical protein